jgi:hypothetical protein
MVPAGRRTREWGNSGVRDDGKTGSAGRNACQSLAALRPWLCPFAFVFFFATIYLNYVWAAGAQADFLRRLLRDTLDAEEAPGKG